MKTYKLSTSTKQEIIDFLLLNGIEWDGYSTPLTFNNITFVYIGDIISSYEINSDGYMSNIIYMDGKHFDILTDIELEIPSNIIEHNPLNHIHTF